MKNKTSLRDTLVCGVMIYLVGGLASQAIHTRSRSASAPLYLRFHPCATDCHTGPTPSAKMLKLPRVKPAWSWTFVAKLVLCLVCFMLACVLVVVQEPNSTASKTADCVTAVAWIFSCTILILGNKRAKPQRWQLLLFWMLEFASSVIVYAMHTALRPPSIVHAIRGVYMASCILLAVLSLFPSDQEEYVDVLLSAYDERTPIRNNEVRAPLFLAHMSEERKLSRNLMYGAEESEFRSVLEDWDETLHPAKKEAVSENK